MCHKCNKCWTNPNFCPCDSFLPNLPNNRLKAQTDVQIIIRYSNQSHGCPNCNLPNCFNYFKGFMD